MRRRAARGRGRGRGLGRWPDRRPPALGLTGWPSANISSSLGSGDFGSWRPTRSACPSYRYTLDELRDPIARQPELAGSTDAWSQVGNDHIVADAFNHGYVQLWSQDRRYEWTNRYDAAADHFAGGYGYLRVGKRVMSTLYDDRPRRRAHGARLRRRLLPPRR